MEESNSKKKILSVLGILVLLAALLGLIWYDRQANKENLKQRQTESQLAMNTSQSEESLETSVNQAKEEETEKSSQSEAGETSEEGSTTQENTLLKQASLVGLEAKEVAGDFVGQEGQITLRSLGNVFSPEKLTKLADDQSQAYKDQLASLQASGIDLSPSPIAGYDYSAMLQQIAPFTSFADLTIANIGSPIAYPQLPLQADQANAPSELLTSLAEIGVDIVSNANIHVLDQGRPGLVATLNNIQSASLESVGLYTDDQDRANGRIIEMNGIRLGFLSYTHDLNGNVIEEGRQYLVGLSDLATMEAEIQALASQVDAVVVSLNLSEEATDQPGQEQRDIYQALSNAGARLILGNNPNASQPVEWLNGQETFAIYSQGSFLAGSDNPTDNQGLILEITFKKDDQGLVTLESPKLMPSLVTVDQAYPQVVALADYQLFKIDQGKDLLDKLSNLLSSYTEDFQLLSHLETNETLEAEAIYR